MRFASLGIGALGLLAACGDSAEAPVALTLEERVATDDRLRPLIQPCSEGRPFTSDTTDMTRVLADKLVFAQLEPLRRAKEELGDMGEAAVEDLTRVFDAALGDDFRQGVLTNVLDVCSIMDGPWGMPLARRALDHPSSTVRLNAFHVFERHGSPEDYEDVALFLDVTSASLRGDVVGVMASLDPVRLAEDLRIWVRDGFYPDQWKTTVPLVVPCAPEDVARELWEGRADMDPELTTFLNAMYARHGNPEALAELRENLVDELNGKRKFALSAIDLAGLEREALIVLQQDHVAPIRYAALEVLGQLEPSPEVNGWLEQALNDVDSDVRAGALGFLAPRGNERAVAETLTLLSGSLAEREDAVRILRAAMPENPGLAEKALEILVRLFNDRVSATASERVSYLQAIGQIPMREAAEFLMQVGDGPDVTIGGLPGHRWSAVQVYNTGPLGVAYLRDRLATETDLFRRLDLLHTIWQTEDDEARELLLALVNDPETSPYELLYAAEKLARIGPASVVAPLLKRVYLANTDPIARPGLQCLLWAWYG